MSRLSGFNRFGSGVGGASRRDAKADELAHRRPVHVLRFAAAVSVALLSSVAPVGPASMASAAPTRAADPATPPDPPTNVRVTAKNQAIDASWEVGGSGTGTITGFIATASPGGAQCTTVNHQCTITDLTAGTAYTVTVVAISTVGTSEPSAPTQPVAPYRAPDAPSRATAVPGNGSAAVSWTEPANLGSGHLIGYQVEINAQYPCVPAATNICHAQLGRPSWWFMHQNTTGATSYVFSGLRNGVTYGVSVLAASDVDNSPWGRNLTLVTPGSPELPGAVPHSRGTLNSSAGSTFAESSGVTTLTGSGFSPNTPVVIGLYPGPAIVATVLSDQQGDISATVTVPTGLPGPRTLVAFGHVNDIKTIASAQWQLSEPTFMALTLPITGTSVLPVTGPATGDIVLLGIVLIFVGAVLAYGKSRWPASCGVPRRR